MFAGTYRSEFYRAVRNLLHDQVTHPDSPEVARRWDELCASEARLPPAPGRRRRRRSAACNRRRPFADTPMTDLLLTHGYFLAEDEKERQIMKPYPPLGLLYLSAFLKRAGYSVEIFDSTFARAQPSSTARFAATPGGVVGIYTNLMTRRSVLEIVRSAQAAWLDRGPGRPRERELPRGIPRCRRRRHRHRRRRAHSLRAPARARALAARTACTRCLASRFATRPARSCARPSAPRSPISTPCLCRIAKPSTTSSTSTPGRLTMARAAST